MKAEVTINELRVGNLVHLIADGHENEPDLVNWIVDDFEFYQNRMKDIQPIPLTEEWLLKFGWIFNIETNSYEKERMPNGHLAKTSFGWDMFNYVLKSKTTNKTFYFVHQLQNLYFALTGEELTIKTK